MRRAFTLIELLVVVAIIAILAAIAVPNFLEAVTRSKVSRTLSDLRVLANASTMYRVDWGRFPPDNFPGQERDAESLFRLSTPVAYVSSIPFEAFHPNESTNPRLDRHHEYWLGGWGPNGQEFDPGTGQGGIWPRFSSVGPDLDSDAYLEGYLSISPAAIAARAPEFLNIVYDPTNGTVSNGDIIASNRGLEN